MRYSKKDLKMAKAIFENCLKEGKVDEAKLLMWIPRLRQLGPKNGLRILKSLLKQVSGYYARHTLLVESAKELQPMYLDKIRLIFEKKLKKRLNIHFNKNESLIAGIKITLGDTVWDYSVNNSLKTLKEVSRG